MSINLSQLHAASDPVLFHSDNLKNLHVRVTGMKNVYRDKNTNQWVSKAFTIDFWGPTAEIAAQYIKKGTCFHVEGTLDSFDRESGLLTADGKKKVFRENSIRCQRLTFGGPTMKEIHALVQANLNAMYASGRIPQNVTITADDMVTRNNKPQKVAYDLNIARQTGKFGNAKVWVKGEGFVGPNAAAGNAAPAQPPVPPADNNVDLTALAAIIAGMQNAKANVAPPAESAAAAVPAGGVNVF